MSNMSISRRSLLKWSALAATSTHLVACSSGDDETVTPPKTIASSVLPAGGEWKPNFCFLGCGGGCVNMSYVKDGVILRQKTDDSHADSTYFPQLRGCLKGRSTRQIIYSANRLKYPMKRKSWNPGSGPKNGHLRGRDEWERISWEEAIKLTGDELNRIYADTGPLSVLNLASELDVQTLNVKGGAMSQWGHMSLGAWPFVTNMMTGGRWRAENGSGADRITLLEDTKLLVLWGQNPAWTKFGLAPHTYRDFKERGGKIIFVDPWYNPSAQALADEWVPVRPGTDIVLLLAIAHELINTADGVDEAFMKKYTVGYRFEAGYTIPKEITVNEQGVVTPSANDISGEALKDNFYDYVMGTYDGTPKTADWASKICGTPVATIKSLAQQMSYANTAKAGKPMALKCSMAPGRTDIGPEFVQTFYATGLMTGNLGIPGGEVVGEGQHMTYTFKGPLLVIGGDFPRHWSGASNPACTSPRGGYAGKPLSLQKGTFERLDANNERREFGIAYANLWDAVMTGKHEHPFEDNTTLANEIKALVGIGMNGGNRLSSVTNGHKGIEAFRKVDFVVKSDFTFSTDCQHADIVFPIATPYEVAEYSFGMDHREFWGMSTGKVIEPIHECKSDDDVEKLLMEYMNVGETHPIRTKSAEQLRHDSMVYGIVRKEDNSGYDALVEFTDQDVTELASKGITVAAQPGRVPYKEFKKKGWYQIERKPGDAFKYTPYEKDFRTDPVTPLKTPSGLFELHCQALVQRMTQIGLTKDLSPIGKYKPRGENFHATYANGDINAGVKSAYPFQFITVHPLQRVHGTWGYVESLREVNPDNIWINDIDAAKLGIEHADWVKISADVGDTDPITGTGTPTVVHAARRAIVTPTVVPGVIVMMEGGSINIANKDTASAIDISGNTGMLVKSKLVGEGHLAWNTSVCNIEKLTDYTGDVPLNPDFLIKPIEPKMAN